MTLPPNYQAALDRARNAYFRSLGVGTALDRWQFKDYKKKLAELAALLDIDEDQAYQLVITPRKDS